MDQKQAELLFSLADSGFALSNIAQYLKQSISLTSNQLIFLKIHGQQAFIDYYVNHIKPKYTSFELSCIVEYLIENQINVNTGSVIFRVPYSQMYWAYINRKKQGEPLNSLAKANLVKLPENFKKDEYVLKKVPAFAGLSADDSTNASSNEFTSQSDAATLQDDGVKSHPVSEEEWARLPQNVLIDAINDDSYALKVMLASPEQIRAWSYGEITSTETINYRLFTPISDGLFCEKIFGPVADYCCRCGKLGNEFIEGTVCQKCGVEYTSAGVRRERMGHIELATPVVNPLFLFQSAFNISTLLDMTIQSVKQILNFELYVDTHQDFDQARERLYRYDEAHDMLQQDSEAASGLKTGADAILALLSMVDLNKELDRDRFMFDFTNNEMLQRELKKRIDCLESFLQSGNKPEWIILRALPVLPPDLRPIVRRDESLYRSSLNDLYRVVIIRNNRLKYLLKNDVSEVVVNNEKRLLQKAVCDLFGVRLYETKFDINYEVSALNFSRFIHQHILYKRVDYSGLSAYIPDPSLSLHQCGLPKAMALELFKPFVLGELIRNFNCKNLLIANQRFQMQTYSVWRALDKVVKNSQVILAKFPIISRQNIESFSVILSEHKAISLNPMAIQYFNNNLDFDYLTVFVPLSLTAKAESDYILRADHNTLSPETGEFNILPDQEMVVGLYYMTEVKVGAKGEGLILADAKEAERLYESGVVDLQARIACRIATQAYLPNKSKLVDNVEMRLTTVGRAILSLYLPKGISFDLIDRQSDDVSSEQVRKLLGGKDWFVYVSEQALDLDRIKGLLQHCYKVVGQSETVSFLDRLKSIGLKHVTRAGLSLCMDDILVPNDKEKITEALLNDIQTIHQEQTDHLITLQESCQKSNEVWLKANEHLKQSVLDNLLAKQVTNNSLNQEEQQVVENSLAMMVQSGALSATDNIHHLAGMVGLKANRDGYLRSEAISSSFRDGLDSTQYFSLSSSIRQRGYYLKERTNHIARPLSRRVAAATNGLLISENDCKTTDGIEVSSLNRGKLVIESLRERILGRTLATDVLNPRNKNVLLPAGTLLDDLCCDVLEEHRITQVKVRSPITCSSKGGVCAKCYGVDLSRGELIKTCEAIGASVALAFKAKFDLLRDHPVYLDNNDEHIFSLSGVTSEQSGIIKLVKANSVINREGKEVIVSYKAEVFVVDEFGQTKESHKIPYGAVLEVKDGQEVAANTALAKWKPDVHPIVAEVPCRVRWLDFAEGQNFVRKVDKQSGDTYVEIEISTVEGSHNSAVKQLPALSLVDTYGNEILFPETDIPAKYKLEETTQVLLEDGQEVYPGDVVAYLPLREKVVDESIKPMSHILKLFKGFASANKAILAECSGTICIGEIINRKQVVLIYPDKNEDKITLANQAVVPCRINVSLSQPLLVYHGQRVQKGEMIAYGVKLTQDVFRLCGTNAFVDFFIRELQLVFALHGIKINDKHIEVVLRQMLSKCEILDNASKAKLNKGDIVDIRIVRDLNKKLQSQGEPLIKYSQILQTFATLINANDSFVASLFFGNSLKNLANAAMLGQVDKLQGMYESILVGRLPLIGVVADNRKARSTRVKRNTAVCVHKGVRNR